MKDKFKIALIATALLLAPPVFAQQKTTMELLGERTKLQAEMDSIQKEFERNRAEFNKSAAAIEHNAKQGKLRQNYAGLEQKMNALNKSIADTIARETKQEKAKEAKAAKE